MHGNGEGDLRFGDLSLQAADPDRMHDGRHVEWGIGREADLPGLRYGDDEAPGCVPGKLRNKSKEEWLCACKPSSGTALACKNKEIFKYQQFHLR